MSTDEPSKSKAKKAQRDAERQRKGKKRKHAETVEEANGDEQQEDLVKDFIPLAAEIDEQSNGVVAAPIPSKKRKHTTEPERDVPSQEHQAQVEAGGEPTAKRKKRKKVKETTVEGADGAQDDAAPIADKPTKSRFIVFVGNLPYETTDAALQTHFKKLSPFTLRHRTDPQTKKSKGFAFLEFENYDRMKTCLKLYHHSMFDMADHPAAAGTKPQGKTKKNTARRINVELTAGGGGKGDVRKQKLTEKNVRLEEQRKRRAEAEVKEKAAAERKAAKKGRQSDGKEKDDGRAAEEAQTGGMHPSRLARLQG